MLTGRCSSCLPVCSRYQVDGVEVKRHTYGAYPCCPGVLVLWACMAGPAWGCVSRVRAGTCYAPCAPQPSGPACPPLPPLPPSSSIPGAERDSSRPLTHPPTPPPGPPLGAAEDSYWPVLLYEVSLSRQNLIYSLKILTPQVVLTMVAFSTFWLSPECGER